MLARAAVLGLAALFVVFIVTWIGPWAILALPAYLVTVVVLALLTAGAEIPPDARLGIAVLVPAASIIMMLGLVKLAGLF